MEDSPNGFCVLITTEETWKKNQCQDDSMSALGDDAIKKLENLRLEEMMGGCYEATGWDREDLRKALAKDGFLTDVDFDKWASQDFD